MGLTGVDSLIAWEQWLNGDWFYFFSSSLCDTFCFHCQPLNRVELGHRHLGNNNLFVKKKIWKIQCSVGSPFGKDSKHFFYPSIWSKIKLGINKLDRDTEENEFLIHMLRIHLVFWFFQMSLCPHWGSHKLSSLLLFWIHSFSSLITVSSFRMEFVPFVCSSERTVPHT